MLREKSGILNTLLEYFTQREWTEVVSFGLKVKAQKQDKKA